MAIRSAKNIIRETRIQSGMTQEEMADGICSLQALSRIECGFENVSSTTFEALMHRAGFPRSRFPVFVSRDDFECYRSLKYARLHLDAWQLAPAWNELQKLKALNWGANKYYYQEWLFFVQPASISLLLLRSHKKLYCFDGRASYHPSTFYSRQTHKSTIDQN